MVSAIHRFTLQTQRTFHKSFISAPCDDVSIAHILMYVHRTKQGCKYGFYSGVALCLSEARILAYSFRFVAVSSFTLHYDTLYAYN